MKLMDLIVSSNFPPIISDKWKGSTLQEKGMLKPLNVQEKKKKEETGFLAEKHRYTDKDSLLRSWQEHSTASSQTGHRELVCSAEEASGIAFYEEADVQVVPASFSQQTSLSSQVSNPSAAVRMLRIF